MYYTKWVFSLYFGIHQHVLCVSMHISRISLEKKLLSFVSWSSVASLIKSHSNYDSFCLSPTQVTKQMRDFKIFNALSSSSSYQHQEHLRVGSKTFTTSSFWYCFWKSFFSLSFFFDAGDILIIRKLCHCETIVKIMPVRPINVSLFDLNKHLF